MLDVAGDGKAVPAGARVSKSTWRINCAWLRKGIFTCHECHAFQQKRKACCKEIAFRILSDSGKYVCRHDSSEADFNLSAVKTFVGFSSVFGAYIHRK